MQKRFIKSHSLNNGTCPFSFSGPRSCKRPGAGCTPTSTKIRLTVSLWSRAYLTDKQCQLQYLQNRAYHAFVSAETTLPSSDLVGLILEFAQQTIRLHKFQSHSFPGQMKLKPWTYIVVKIRVLSWDLDSDCTSRPISYPISHIPLPIHLRRFIDSNYTYPTNPMFSLAKSRAIISQHFSKLLKEVFVRQSRMSLRKESWTAELSGCLGVWWLKMIEASMILNGSVLNHPQHTLSATRHQGDSLWLRGVWDLQVPSHHHETWVFDNFKRQKDPTPRPNIKWKV